MHAKSHSHVSTETVIDRSQGHIHVLILKPSEGRGETPDVSTDIGGSNFGELTRSLELISTIMEFSM